MSQKNKILLSVYACEPNRGSEPGVGWNWAIGMTEYFDVWVVTRQNNKQVIEAYMKEHQIKNIKFLYYDPPSKILLLKKILGVHLFYTLWQIGVNSLIKVTMLKEDIEFFHSLTFGSALLPVSSFGQKKILFGDLLVAVILFRESIQNIIL